MTSPIDDAHDADAKLSLQQRRQLSALVDGDLAPDQARFLLRRLGHDPELAGRWQRWQLIGDVLRGQPVAALAAGADGFAAGVATAVSREAPREAVARRPRWQHVAALAASLAVVAVLVVRPPAADDVPPGPAPAASVASAATDPAPVAAPVAGVAPAVAGDPPATTVEPVREVSVPQFADAAPQPATVPGRRVAAEPPRMPPAMSATPAGDGPAAGEVGSTLVLAGADAGAADPLPPALRPFARPDEPQARPWPRATVPGLAGSEGGFTVGFDRAAAPPAATPPFYPFEPRLPADPDPETNP